MYHPRGPSSQTRRQKLGLSSSLTGAFPSRRPPPRLHQHSPRLLERVHCLLHAQPLPRLRQRHLRLLGLDPGHVLLKKREDRPPPHGHPSGGRLRAPRPPRASQLPWQSSERVLARRAQASRGIHRVHPPRPRETPGPPSPYDGLDITLLHYMNRHIFK